MSLKGFQKPEITYELKGKIAFITINRPHRLNALTPECARELGRVWTRFRDDESAWVAIITGAGEKAFSIGYEVSKGALSLSGAIASLAAIPTSYDIWKPIVAAIKGYCIAGGWWIAQECDIRVASEDAQFGITQVRWGLMPAFSASLSCNLLPGHALELLLIGNRIGARRAYEMGFVNLVVPRNEVMNAAIEVAERLCANAPIAVRKTKELFYRGRMLNHEEAMQLTWQLYAENEKTEDCQEGINAFLERRKPKYRGV